jgi:predicted transcriptional regulator
MQSKQISREQKPSMSSQSRRPTQLEIFECSWLVLWTRPFIKDAQVEDESESDDIDVNFNCCVLGVSASYLLA